MIKTLSDVSNNKYINNFMEIIKEYSLFGTYVKYYSAADQQENIYFICGSNEQRVNSDTLNVDALTAAQIKQYEFFNPHVAAFKLTGSDPFLLHQEVVRYCQRAELVNKLYNERKLDLPLVVREDLVETLKMLHDNAANPMLNEVVRSSYSKAITDAIRGQGTPFEITYTKDGEPVYYLSKDYDTQKSRFENWKRFNIASERTSVSLEHLILNSDGIDRISVPAANAEKVCNELQKRPEIVFWKSEVLGEKLNVPDAQGYGSSQENDRRFVVFAYDRVYASDVFAIVNQIDRPDAYSLTVKSILAESPQHTQSANVLVSNYETFAEACKRFNVKHCICNNSHNVDVINVFMASNSQENIDSALSSVTNEKSAKHTYVTLEDRRAELMAARDQQQFSEYLLREASKLLSNNEEPPQLEILSSFGDLHSYGCDEDDDRTPF